MGFNVSSFRASKRVSDGKNMGFISKSSKTSFFFAHIHKRILKKKKNEKTGFWKGGRIWQGWGGMNTSGRKRDRS